MWRLAVWVEQICAMATTREQQPVQLLNLAQAAARLGIGRTSMWKLLRTGALPWVDVLGRRKVAERDLAAFVEANRSQN